MNAAQVSSNPGSREKTDLIAPEQLVSALVDGEVDAGQLAGMFTAERDRDELLGSWHAYQVIGDVLRGEGAAAPSRAPVDFLAGVRERLRSETVPAAEPAQDRHLRTPAQSVTQVGGAAANDAVFRWKLVAGFASLAAVMAVSWSVLSGAPPSAGGSAAPQLAAVPALPEAPASVVANVSEPSSAVVVNTGQGPLIRDARLEELLAEHRQHGSMSALQMPTGFIRNATYDAAGR